MPNWKHFFPADYSVSSLPSNNDDDNDPDNLDLFVQRAINRVAVRGNPAHSRQHSADAGPSTASSTTSQPPSSIPQAPVAASTEPVQQISMRSLIVTQDASIIIGRGGSHVNEIRVSLLSFIRYQMFLGGGATSRHIPLRE